MLCSNCSHVIRPVVAIDIDGTLGEYHQHFLDFAMAYLGYQQETSQYRGAETYKRWFCDRYGVPERTWHDIKLAYRQGAQKRTMPMFNWSHYLTVNVQVFAELWLTTTRPYLRLDSIDPDTRFWLDRHNIKYDYLLYDEDKYGELAGKVDRERVVAVIDDLPDNLNRADELFGEHIGILMRRPHNSAQWSQFGPWNTADDGQKALQLISRRVQEWDHKVMGVA
jgi:hypothetical protein